MYLRFLAHQFPGKNSYTNKRSSSLPPPHIHKNETVNPKREARIWTALIMFYCFPLEQLVLCFIIYHCICFQSSISWLKWIAKITTSKGPIKSFNCFFGFWKPGLCEDYMALPTPIYVPLMGRQYRDLYESWLLKTNSPITILYLLITTAFLLQ